MKTSLLIGLFLMVFVGFIQAATDYEADEQYFYVDEPLNDSLMSARMIMCIMSSMKPDAFVNDGNYLAAVNLEACNKQSEGESDSAQQLATQKPENIESKNKQAAGETGAQGEKKDQKFMLESVLSVTRDSTADPVITKAWIGHNDPEMESKIYTRIKQTAGLSANAPNGEFEMHWTAIAGKSHPITEEGQFQGWGYLKAEGSSISMIEESMDYYEKFIANYGEDGTIEGTFAADFDPDIENQDDAFYKAFYKFYINDKDKSYCKKLIEVEKTSLKPKAQQEDLYVTQTVAEASYGDLGIDTVDEECFSTKRAEATRNVFSYGVYNQDGSRLDLGGLAKLSLQAEVTNEEGDKVNVYAHADSNSNDVWVDYEYAHLLNENTVFKQEVYDDEQVKSDKTYRLKPSLISVEKYETVKVSLASLDGMPFEMDGNLVKKFIGRSDELGGDDSIHYHYNGFYSAKNKEFKLTHIIIDYYEGDKYRQRREPLNKNTIYALDTIINNMTNTASFDIFLSNSYRSYQINKQSLLNPSDAEVKTKTISQVSLSDMQEKELFCVKNCVTVATLKKTFDDAKEKLKKEDDIDTDTETVNTITITSPYVDYDEEQLDGLVKYKFSNSKVYSSEPKNTQSKQIFQDNLFASLLDSNNDYFDKLQHIEIAGKWSIAWGVDAGILVGQGDMDKLKCDNVGDDGDQYCPNQFWQVYNDIDTYYVVRYEVMPSFELFTESGESVEFVEPKTLFYTVPDGDHNKAGNRFALDYYGHGQLSGIPSHVYNIDTGEVVGEYTHQWNENYVDVDQFTIPDNGELVDENDEKYKVKALFGDAWLKKEPKFIGKYSYDGNKESIPSDDQLFIKDGLDAYDILMEMPENNIINDGKPSVIHGEIIYDPTPNAK
jgi:hypothetical protein